MKKLLESMEFGKYVLISELGMNYDQTPISGFTFQSDNMDVIDNRIVAMDGDTFETSGTCFRCGNNLQALLYNNPDCEDPDRISLGSLFPDRNLVIAATGGRIVFFAPICNSKIELADFLLKIDKFFKEHTGRFPWYVHDHFIDLALWLYKHNPGKKQETSWGI